MAGEAPRADAPADRAGWAEPIIDLVSYRKIAAGTFPTQHKLAERCCGWRAGEVEMWLRNPQSFTMADLKREAA
ncbi:helix-turn-helix transcriptional regulator [Sphingopyxis fribergensis]